MIAATGIVTLVALALPNAGALNALCSLGPYGGSALLAGGALVTTIALAVCLLARVCSSRSNVQADESADVRESDSVSESEDEIDDDYKTAIDAVRNKKREEQDISEYNEMLPVILKHHRYPEAMRYLVETYQYSPGLLGMWVLNPLHSPQNQKLGPLPAGYDRHVNSAIFSAIREAKSGVFAEVIRWSCSNYELIPFELFDKELNYLEGFIILNIVQIIVKTRRDPPDTMILNFFYSLYGAMFSLKNCSQKEKALRLHDRIFQQARNHFSAKVLKEPLQYIESHIQSRTSFQRTQEEKALDQFYLEVVQRDLEVVEQL